MYRADAIQFLIERDGFVCYLCEVEFTPENMKSAGRDKVTIDHVIPRSRGGEDEIENYALAHFSCNQEKADRLFLPDGTLEPKSSRVQSQAIRRANKRDILSRFCNECWDGRLLEEDDICPYCESTAGPEKWPWYLKREPKVCSHEDGEWCYFCTLGLVE